MTMNRRAFMKMGSASVAMLSTAVGPGTLRHSAATSRRPPNVIVIFTDDQGYQDLGCFGSPHIRTPNIDRMAQEGMRFTDFYVGASVCTPSRASLLTGCYPERVGNLPVLFPKDKRGLHPNEITIADLLKTRGYATACVGKWHLGHLEPFLPTSQGFDTYFGIPYSNDMGIDKTMKLAPDIVWREGINEEKFRSGNGGGPPLMRNTEVIECPADQATLTRRYTEEAIRFIKTSANQPFFLYLPHTMPHVPLYASPEFEGKSAIGLYGDVLEEIDWSVGQILQTLKAEGLDEDTLVVFTSDNGPWHFKNPDQHKVKGDTHRRVGGSALPLRGAKFSTWDGGMREPTVMRWPGRIPAGTECQEVVGTIDLLPTFAELSGTQAPQDRIIDGRSIVPIIEGRPGARAPRDAFFYRTQGVRVGPWKLINGELYHLGKDIGETNNVASDNPDVVKRLSDLLEAHKAELNRNKRPAGTLTPDKIPEETK